MKKLIYLAALLLTINMLFLSGCKGSVEEPSAEESSSSALDFE